MPGQTPLNMMRTPGRRERTPPAKPARRRAWPVLLSVVAVLVVVALGWVWLWYYAASVAHRTMAGWIERETAAGRAYSCASESIGGFPLRIEVRCSDPAAAINSTQPPFAVKAKDVVVAAHVFDPTRLVGDIASPLVFAQRGEPESFTATWSNARVSVHGVPPNPDSAAVVLERPRLDRTGDTSAGQTLFSADHADIEGRIIAGSPRHDPVVEAVLRLRAATAPTLHPLTAAPIEGEFRAVLRGFKDFGPKPWNERFRELQAAHGAVEIRYFRVARPDALVVGNGTLTVNANGKLDGTIRVAVVGIERIVPLLGIDRMVGRGIDRFLGAGDADQGLDALDRLMPGLSGVVREGANATLIENLKKMGQPTEIEKKPAILLPLRITDGSLYLGMIPLGTVPPLF